MFKQPSLRITLAILAFCLCLGSQVILPAPVTGIFMLEVSEIDFEQTEFEEDLLAAAISTTIAVLIFLKHDLMNTNFQAASLLPDSPPPKHII